MIGRQDGNSFSIYLLVGDRFAEKHLFLPNCNFEFPLVIYFEGVGTFHFQLDVFGIGSGF